MPSTVPSLTRRPYTGSCHCGHVKYIVYLSLPTQPYPKTTPTDFLKSTGQRIYRCNCTFCHKAGILHIRIPDPANDFFVISPKNPLAEGSGYKGYIFETGEGPWQFCERCGTRAFAVRGDGPVEEEGYNDEADLPTALLQRLHSKAFDGTAGEITAKEDEITRVSVWRPKKDWHDNNAEDGTGTDSLSINAVTLDAHNDNWDLRQLHENGYIGYMQTLQWVGDDLEATPYFGGTY